MRLGFARRDICSGLAKYEVRRPKTHLYAQSARPRGPTTRHARAAQPRNAVSPYYPPTSAARVGSVLSCGEKEKEGEGTITKESGPRERPADEMGDFGAFEGRQAIESLGAGWAQFVSSPPAAGHGP
jgi:hypothetical protein